VEHSRRGFFELGAASADDFRGVGMRSTWGWRLVGATTLSAAALAVCAALVPLDSGAATSSDAAPGVTANSITVGTISTQTGTLAANSSSVIYGERAYFDYVNAHGGVNGRKIDYKYALDDGGNPTTFNQLANTLINQDHVFAVTGVATIFFQPNLFIESGIPTYGYNVTDNWAPAPNLFAAGGSTQYYQAGAAEFAYVARRTESKPSIALVAYGVAASSNACQAAETALKGEGYNISYVDLKIGYPGTTVATDVQRMKQVGSNFVLSCMDVQGNVNMARAIQQYGLKATQLWLNGNDVPTLEANKSLMQGVYFATYHVPFTAPTRLYPGLTLYLQQMKKYEPQYVYNELAIQGWESAALFAQGVKAAGNDLTWANVIKKTNAITQFTAGGLTAPVNWAVGGHSGHAPPYCVAYVVAKGTQYVPTLNKGQNVFNCFHSSSTKADPVFPVPAGTPAPNS
jgi:ABC-type branched-subunit amino acid transport system substrate-binding protein